MVTTMNQEPTIMAILSLLGDDAPLRMDLFESELKRIMEMNLTSSPIHYLFEKNLMEVIESNRVETGLNDGFSIQMANASKFVVLTTLGKGVLDYLTAKYLIAQISEVFNNATESSKNPSP
jgi:hypothetical protein